MKRIIHIQHCESVHHTNGMIGSSTDWELSENGIKQAHNIGRKLKDEISEKYIIISSPLKRAHMTAKIVSDYVDAPIELDERLKERHLGVACGKSSEWAKKNKKPAQKEKDVDFIPWDESESVRDHYNRVEEFLRDVKNRKDSNIILVSHGGTKSVFHTALIGLPVEAMHQINIHSGAGSVSTYFLDESGFTRIRGIGDTYYKQD